MSIFIFSRHSKLGSMMRSNFPYIAANVIEISENDSGRDFYASQLKDAEIILADPSLIAKHALIYNLPKLKWIQSTWAGVEPITSSLDSTLEPPKFTLTRFAGFFGPHMSEYVIANIIAHERQFKLMQKHQEDKIWKKDVFQGYRLLSELSIGILGVGAIGKHVASSCKHFGMEVWGMVSSEVSDAARCEAVDQYRLPTDLSDILGHCDYILNVLPSTPYTIGLLDGDVLSQCKKKPVFINVGRGDVMSTKTIISALDAGWLSHAVLDVMEKEPLPAESPLWNHDKVTITPHISAESFDWQIAECFAENYERYQKGQPLFHAVDWKKGY